MEAEPMHVLQFAKRAVLMLAASSIVLSGCGSESAPTVPFDPVGATADLDAVNTTFDSPAFTSFSALGVLFDAALGGAPLVSGSAAALDLRGGGTAKQLEAARSAERIGRMLQHPAGSSFSASSAAIASEFLGKTFVYSGGSYVVSSETGAPANGVRFILYEIDPLTFLPTDALNRTGRVDLIDMSSATTSAVRVIVAGGGTTYLDYRVSVTSTSTSGQVAVFGFITNGNTEATLNLRSTLTADGGLTLSYSVDVPQRDLSIDLTMAANISSPESSTVSVTLDMRGQNGWVRLTGQFVGDDATLNVAINGTQFATMTSTAGAEPVIIGADGQPLTQEEFDALQRVFEFSGESFFVFDQLLVPVGSFIGGAA
jgi:hypothetical protein